MNIIAFIKHNENTGSLTVDTKNVTCYNPAYLLFSVADYYWKIFMHLVNSIACLCDLMNE